MATSFFNESAQTIPPIPHCRSVFAVCQLCQWHLQFYENLEWGESSFHKFPVHSATHHSSKPGEVSPFRFQALAWFVSHHFTSKKVGISIVSIVSIVGWGFIRTFKTAPSPRAPASPCKSSGKASESTLPSLGALRHRRAAMAWDKIPNEMQLGTWTNQEKRWKLWKIHENNGKTMGENGKMMGTNPIKGGCNGNMFYKWVASPMFDCRRVVLDLAQRDAKRQCPSSIKPLRRPARSARFIAGES